MLLIPEYPTQFRTADEIGYIIKILFVLDYILVLDFFLPFYFVVNSGLNSKLNLISMVANVEEINIYK